MDFNIKVRTLLDILRADIGDLEKWSVYHEDQFSDEISKIKEIVKKMEGENYGK